MNKWLIGIIGSILGFVISQILSYYTFAVSLESTKKIETIHLARELNRNFYTDDPAFREIRMGIEGCQKLYNKWGGKFDHDQINRYLGFFEDLGFYYKKGFLDINVIDHLFGAYIIEAYENNELRKYVDDIRNSYKQKDIHADFQALAKQLEQIPEREAMIEVARRGCAEKPGTSDRSPAKRG